MYKEIKNQSGRLILDLLVVIGVIALIATISMPFYRRYQPNLKLNGTSRDLTSDLRYAQQLTITEQVVHAVSFDLIDNEYQILKIDTATTTIKAVSLDDDVSFQSITGLADDTVFFNFYGAVNESGQIDLINTNNKTATIYIKPSGYVELE